jgi:hypothetical protein
METHHHPDNYPKPKKWKEYFLEFLMIFLAVTLGFIAENFREHLNDRAKEKQYIKSFIHNLRDDTTRLRHVIESNITQSGRKTLTSLGSWSNVDESYRIDTAGFDKLSCKRILIKENSTNNYYSSITFFRCASPQK